MVNFLISQVINSFSRMIFLYGVGYLFNAGTARKRMSLAAESL
jgi:hypothetical protein